MHHSSTIGIIGGTAIKDIPQLLNVSQVSISTPFGKTSSEITQGMLNQKRIVFISRHGIGHKIPPHLINYRANIWALKKAGADKIISIASVGSIRNDISPGDLVVPNQIIDYTWGREHTFFDQEFTIANHIDFTQPYDQKVRQSIIKSAASSNQKIIDGGTMGVTQGPRLETAAEINRMKIDGCDLVGMTGMPEAALARELGIPYACLAVVVNWAAGVSKNEISLSDIEKVLAETAGSIEEILVAYG